MGNKRAASSKPQDARARGAVSLKELAAHLGLSQTTVSLVLNESPLAASIPYGTKQRIVDAARGFDYRPNLVARSLRAQRSFTLGVMVPELSDGYSAMVLSGIEDHLLSAGYFYFVASHRHNDKLIDRYPDLFHQRRVDGIIAVDTPYDRPLPIPMVAVSGHHDRDGVTTIKLDHPRAAQLALEYLVQLGHQSVAFIKGQAFSSDTEIRWRAICGQAERLGLAVHPDLVAQLEGDSPSPELGYIAGNQLLASSAEFSALFAFNDVSAIGAIRAFREAGWRVPEDISVIGVDDIYNAAYFTPALTTIRQPLREMGRLAAETLLRRISSGSAKPYPTELTVQPELVIRQSTNHRAAKQARSR
ncbi:MAG TPA: LacI family DNA-binding transcriptional regulator [Blastocatellia bacterium]|nr:LacI family DNA-binding transcriptional regulator [Blastocatellia bacterium]